MRRPILIALIVILVLLVGSTMWVMWTTPASDPSAPKGPPAILRCPECNTEVSAKPIIDGKPALEGKPCPVCRRGKLEPAARSLHEGDQAFSLSRSPLVLGLFTALVVLCVIHAYFWWRARPRSAPRERYSHLRCPSCKRRVRYIEKIGQRKILCPTCRMELDLLTHAS
jgi:hypothetical protein